MKSRTMRQSLVWGGVLILVGVLLLVETVTDLSAWIWIILLAAGGLGAFGLYRSDRADWPMLLTAYVLWAIALLVALITLNILRDEGIAFYVLLVIALPFLAVYYRDRALWWALIPAYVLIVVAVMVGTLRTRGSGMIAGVFMSLLMRAGTIVPVLVHGTGAPVGRGRQGRKRLQWRHHQGKHQPERRQFVEQAVHSGTPIIKVYRPEHKKT